ncbi:MAG TPA: site-2 protease family protein [Bryobacteraceae bacterium]|jgi:Zn-dependent protease|nr:site-2 protease family protein [Bryobacteraceae bacterium]
MFGRPVTLFKLFGFEVRVDATWLILGVLVAWTLATSYYPSAVKGLSHEQYWWMGIASALGLFVSIVLHEFSHSWVARRHGLPMKGITLFIFGGVAEMSEEPADAKTEFLMAIAGPIASIVLGGFFFVVYEASRSMLPPAVTGTLYYLFWMNLVLAAFNLIPAFPLDGGRVLRSLLWKWKGDLRQATKIASELGGGFGLILILLAVWQWFTGDFVNALWYFLIGLFLRGAAQSSYQQMMIKIALKGEPVRKFMNEHPITAPSYISLEELVDDYVYRYHHKMFPVLDASQRLAGCVTTTKVKAFAREEWNRHSLQEVLEPLSADNTISPETDAAAALAKMVASGRTRLMVVDGETLVGILSLKDLMRFLAAKNELEGAHFPHSHPAPSR